MSRLFSDDSVRLDILRQRAYNYRWAEVPDGVIPLTAADPDFPAPAAVGKALTDYIAGGYFSYTPKMGFPELRTALSHKLRERKGEDVPSKWILPVDSAARGMYVIAQTVLRPGDEALVFDPVDFLFQESVRAAGATPVLFPATLKDGHLDLSRLESALTPKTKLVGLCNPHNPFGALYTRADLEILLDLSEKYGFYILNDEIWSDIVFPEERFVSLLSLGMDRCRRVLSVFGFSKSFGIAGLRVGCIYCADQVLFDRVVAQSAVLTTAGGVSSLSQVAAISCLEQGYPWLDEFLIHLTKNRDYAINRLNAIPGITCQVPRATYLLFPDISRLGLSGEALVDFLQKNVGLALVPGSRKFFGPGAEGHVRICFATSRRILKEGLDRLERGIQMLQNK